MKKQLVLAVLTSLIAVAAFGQKGPLDELGFNPSKLYDFSGIDSVSLFNGNLTLSIPLGVRYEVSSHLSYQFNLIFNGKVWDYESWNTDQCNPSPCPTKVPNLRSNAGLGWRVTLGRLLPPYQGTVSSSLDRPFWMYESPAGDEHPFNTLHSDAPVQVEAAGGLRMIEIDPNTRDVEFASGEIHRFEYQSGDWRLTQIRDRFGNSVSVAYTFDSGGGETQWTVTDTVGRSHTITMVYESSMSDGWARGWMVHDVNLQGLDGTSNHYQFTYTPRSTLGTACTVDGLDAVPLLTGVSLPDGTAYGFTYAASGAACIDGELSRMTYPTGGTVTYEYRNREYPNAGDLCGDRPLVDEVTSRTTDDGNGPQKWEYHYNHGADVPHTWDAPNPDNPCDTDFPYQAASPPTYWARTSVLSPTQTVNGVVYRDRTDHYFDVLTTNTTAGSAVLTNPFSSGSGGDYGFTGPSGAPPLVARRGPVDQDFSSISDVPSSDVGGGLSTEVFGNCSATGDCSAGTVLRSTYDTYDRYDSSDPYNQKLRLIRMRTAYDDDTSCPAGCYTQWTKSDDNGFFQYRTTTNETNFPSLMTSTETFGYPTWGANDLLDVSNLWVADRYTGKTHTEGTVTNSETFCFDSTTGAVLRQRVLAGSAAGPHDLLHVFGYDSAHGDLQYTSDYGGDGQSIDTGSDLCNTALPAQPVYKQESGYTTGGSTGGVYGGGIRTTARYLDPVTGAPLGFYFVDRSIDRFTGAVTASRDAAGVATTFEYDPVPARVHSVTTPAGAVTTYTYTGATGAAGGAFTQAKVDASTAASAGTLGAQWVFDGLGRLVRSASSGPTSWSATQTAFDGQGRVASKSEPESTGSGPPAGPLTAAYKVVYGYDALGRTTSVTNPDNSVVSFAYSGASSKTRSTNIWTGGSGDTAVQSTERYDGFGRLIGVTEASGPTTSMAPNGASVLTSYSYDLGSRLTGVKMGLGTHDAQGDHFTGTVQTRIFDYDGRGFLRWESQPESGMLSYTYDAGGNVLSKIQSAANSQFDLNYTFDPAERVVRVDGRNPLYDPNDPSQPQFHAIKEFTYAADNGTFVRGGNTLTDLARGKLATATRHNYGSIASDPLYDVEDQYHYGDSSGHKTDRTTVISRTQGGYTNVVQSVSMSESYNDLDLPATITYPMCDGCGTPPSDPDRSGMARAYSSGRLKSLSNYITDISYWPNGMRNVLSHANGIDDTQSVLDMSRPSSIAFGTSANPYDRCVPPAFTLQPASAVNSGSGVTLTVSVTGTGPFTYVWYSSASGEPIATHANVSATSDSVMVSPATATSYTVTVSNPCGYETSEWANVSSNCSAPTTGSIQAVAQPDGTWILTPSPTAQQSRTFAWTRPPDATVLGTAETLPVPALATTATYQLTVTDSCGTGTGQVTISVPLPITTGLLATALPSYDQVTLSWPAIGGASLYTILRRSLGGAWETAGTSITNSFTDGTVAQSRTYVYHVTSDNGGQTDYDVATTNGFPQALAWTPIDTTSINGMLSAVNSVRAAAGWPTITWSNILATTDPVPDPGAFITARQLMACRERMNEALQALGVTVRPYTETDLKNVVIKADYINEIQGRAQ